MVIRRVLSVAALAFSAASFWPRELSAEEGAARAAGAAAAAEAESISTARYVTAGILGIFPGYGIGHAVAGEWSETGWIFTTGEVATALLIGFTGALSGLSDTGPKGAPIGLLVTFGAFRVVEIVDIWTRPTVRDEPAAPNAAAPGMSRWAALPVLQRDGGGVLLVGSF